MLYFKAYNIYSIQYQPINLNLRKTVTKTTNEGKIQNLTKTSKVQF